VTATSDFQAATTFELPGELSASEPPEARGLRRDEVRLLVAGDGPLRSDMFRNLGRHLSPGDLVVVNTSATLPAAVDGRRENGTAVAVHVSGPAADGQWLVELRDAGRARVKDAAAGERIELPLGVVATLLAAYPDPSVAFGSRLWVAEMNAGMSLPSYLHRVGRPIAYGYLRSAWSLRSYQTIFGRHPGSAEMPSAGRPFSRRMLVDLATRGIAVAPITLHTGVSSLEADERPLPERFEVPAATARLVNDTRAAGGRVIAVGTTVTRALESAADQDGRAAPASGWTQLVIEPGRGVGLVDGLITGWHEPAASHLLLLEAVAGPALVQAAYDAALRERYLWHEFGDTCLFLPS